MTALDLKFAAKAAQAQHARSEITTDELYTAVDAYIKAIREFKKRTKAKISIPSRGCILRAP